MLVEVEVRSFIVPSHENKQLKQKTINQIQIQIQIKSYRYQMPVAIPG